MVGIRGFAGHIRTRQNLLVTAAVPRQPTDSGAVELRHDIIMCEHRAGRAAGGSQPRVTSVGQCHRQTREQSDSAPDIMRSAVLRLCGLLLCVSGSYAGE